MFLTQLEYDWQKKKIAFRLIFQKLLRKISQYGNAEVAIYVTGREADKLMEEIGRPLQIKGFLTKDKTAGEFSDYPILDIGTMDNVKCILIASKDYKKRIKHLESNSLTIAQVYE